MKYLQLFILLTFLCAMGVSAQNKPVFTEHHIHSSILNQDRQVIIHLPASYTKSKRYPVIYLLDGEEHTLYTGAVTDKLWNAGFIPEVIVVGITNVDRTKDLTPVPRAKNATGNEATGGGDRFVSFIGKELFAYVDSAYSTLPFRILIGHSYGGLLAVHTLFSEKNKFNAYMAIDPSLYWADYYLLNTARERTGGFSNSMLYMSGIINPAHPNDSSSNGVGIAALENILKTKSFRGLRYTFQNFENENHESVPMISILEGLRSVFHGYYFSDAIRDSAVVHPQIVIDHYAMLSAKLGVPILPDEKLIDELGFYALYELHLVNKAIDLFTLNTVNYPRSPNAFNSLSTAYKELGDNSSAFKYHYIAVDLTTLEASDE